MAIQQDFNQQIKIQANSFGKFMWYLSFILIFPIFIHIGNRNSLRRMETKINEADSEIDVQLVKRRDLLVKLISTVKQEMTFEKELLTNVTKMRSQHLDGLTVQEKSAFNQQMDQVQRGINVQLEAYPNIKSLTNVLQLQNAISDVEEDIAAARRIYNSNVSFYNQDLQTYPMSVAANGLITKPFFEASEKQREDVEINLI